MNRLTIMTGKGPALAMPNKPMYEREARRALMERYHKAVERLAAYENTGLEPKEIAALHTANADQADKLRRAQETIRDLQEQILLLGVEHDGGRACPSEDVLDGREP